MNIGSVTVQAKALLAPMAGVTDAPFRLAAQRCGAQYTVSEMIVGDQFLAENALSVLRAAAPSVSSSSEPAPLQVVQLAGREPGKMAEAARRLEAGGVDIIDINMGCPAKRVTAGACGAALMRDPARAAKIVGAVASAAAVPVTVKIRLGWSDAERNGAVIARIAEAEGAQLITVHGRTREQLYKGVADWRAVRAVCEAVRVPVVINGDIGDCASARAALCQSGAEAVMIGRGARGAPWRVAEVDAALRGGADAAAAGGVRTRSAFRRELILEHFENMLSHYGPGPGLRCARKHLKAYLAPNAASMRFLPRLLRTDEAAEARRLLASALAAQAENPDFSGAA